MVKQSELRSQIRQYMTKLRKQAAHIHRSHNELEEVIFTDLRKSYLHGEYVDRLVLFLRGTGCTWANDNGGCTFCGFWNATNFGNKIPNEDYLHQVSLVLSNSDVIAQNYPIFSLYNDGSLFEEREIDFDVVLQICSMIAEVPSARRIVIETKVIDIEEEKIAALKKFLVRLNWRLRSVLNQQTRQYAISVSIKISLLNFLKKKWKSCNGMACVWCR